MPKRSHSGSLKRERVANVACPFCPLLCDDLEIEAHDDALTVRNNGCAQALAGFKQTPRGATALIDGKRASRKAAVEAAVRILKRATAPLISGLGTDVDGARSAVALTEKARGIIDHADSAGLDSGMRVLQTRGWYTTTLAEVRNRADLIVFVGANVVDNYANFVRRTVDPTQTLHGDRRKGRRVFFLGDRTATPVSAKSVAVESIATAPTDLAETMGILRALVAGRTTSGGTRARRLAGLAQAIGEAQYPVFVWAPGQLPRNDADLIIATVTRLVDDLNREQRAAGLALGGDNGAISAANACAWLTGFPLHISFAGKTIEYDPVRYRTAHLLGENAIDALVWIDAFGAAPLPETAPGTPRIAIGSPQAPANLAADVFIPTGIPGVDHGGRLVRTDSVVTLRVDQLRRRRADSVADVLRDILAQW